MDTSKFQAHSTRAAAASKAALSGLAVEDILKAADWSSEGVFQKFYYKPEFSTVLVLLFWQLGLQNHMLIWRPSPPRYNFQIAQVM